MMDSAKERGALRVRFLQVIHRMDGEHKIRMQFMRVFVNAINKLLGDRRPPITKV